MVHISPFFIVFGVESTLWFQRCTSTFQPHTITFLVSAIESASAALYSNLCMDSKKSTFAAVWPEAQIRSSCLYTLGRQDFSQSQPVLAMSKTSPSKNFKLRSTLTCSSLGFLFLPGSIFISSRSRHADTTSNWQSAPSSEDTSSITDGRPFISRSRILAMLLSVIEEDTTSNWQSTPSLEYHICVPRTTADDLARTLLRNVEKDVPLEAGVPAFCHSSCKLCFSSSRHPSWFDVSSYCCCILTNNWRSDVQEKQTSVEWPREVQESLVESV